MTQPQNSIYRNALQVSPERIASMSEIELNLLMVQLLRAQAYKFGSALSEIRVNTEERAPDDGSDGWSAKPMSPDGWLGSVNTCWQFKAGTAGRPSRLSGEITKEIPKTTLSDGGRFVLVASGDGSGTAGENRRRQKLISEATAANIPAEKI